jgi:hypothetical protein
MSLPRRATDWKATGWAQRSLDCRLMRMTVRPRPTNPPKRARERSRNHGWRKASYSSRRRMKNNAFRTPLAHRCSYPHHSLDLVCDRPRIERRWVSCSTQAPPMARLRNGTNASSLAPDPCGVCSATPKGGIRERYDICPACGQVMDVRSFAEVFHHKEEGHWPLTEAERTELELRL